MNTPSLPKKRFKHYSRRTELTHAHWIKRFILFHGKRHSRDMGATEIEAFLSALATERNVSASIQNLALLPFCSCTRKYWRGVLSSLDRMA